MTQHRISIQKCEFAKRPTLWLVSRDEEPSLDEWRRSRTLGFGTELIAAFRNEAEAAEFAAHIRSEPAAE